MSGIFVLSPISAYYSVMAEIFAPSPTIVRREACRVLACDSKRFSGVINNWQRANLGLQNVGADAVSRMLEPGYLANYLSLEYVHISFTYVEPVVPQPSTMIHEGLHVSVTSFVHVWEH